MQAGEVELSNDLEEELESFLPPLLHLDPAKPSF